MKNTDELLEIMCKYHLALNCGLKSFPIDLEDFIFITDKANKVKDLQQQIDSFEKARKSYLQACEELEAHANDPTTILSIVSELKEALVSDFRKGMDIFEKKDNEKIPECVVNEGETMLYGATPKTNRT